MSNVLKEEKRQQVLALGRLGWSLRQIEEATGVRRETASGYLKAAGLKVRGRGRPPARPAKPAISPEMPTDSSPATAAGKGTAAAAPVPAQQPSRAPQASACEPYRELIVDALGRGRNAMAIWQDLIDDHGFPAGLEAIGPPPVVLLAGRKHATTVTVASGSGDRTPCSRLSAKRRT